MQTHYPFDPSPLPYDYISLVPYCDPDTLYLHHKNIYGQNVAMLNYLLSSYPQYHSWTPEELIQGTLLMPTQQQRLIRNFAGSLYNHTLYFDGMSHHQTSPHGMLYQALRDHYGSIDNFRQLFIQAAHNVLGSGWVWLNSDRTGGVHIAITPDNKIPSIASITPIFVADVWEHAYYLRYPAKLAEYLNAWFSTLDWKKAEKRFLDSLSTAEEDQNRF